MVPSWGRYWPEALILCLFTYVGVLLVDALKEKQLADVHFNEVQSFQSDVSRLTVATLLIEHTTTQHYDKHAQLLTSAEKHWSVFPKAQRFSQEWSDFKRNVSHYVQLASMLKTSKRFVANSEYYFKGNMDSFGRAGEHVLSLLMEFTATLEPEVALEVMLAMKDDEDELKKLSDLGVQWPMLKQHIQFILDNSIEVNTLVNRFQTLPFSESLDQQVESFEIIKQKTSRMFDYLTMGLLLCFLSLVAVVFGRQLQLIKLNSRKVEASALVKERFLANMSHEIRTPLNGIIGLAELCLNTKLTHIQQDYLGNLLKSGKSLLRIVNDILDFSKLEEGQLEVYPNAFEVESIFSELKSSVALHAVQKGIDLKFAISDNVPPSLIGDKSRIYQVMLNLVSNAIKFTESGSVTVSIRRVTVSSETQHFVFDVEDTGIGIRDEQVKTLFTRFKQADSSTTRKFGGTGLGLAISKHLVSLMGGIISVDSQLGQGSKFSFQLPLVSLPQQKDAEQKSPLANRFETLLLTEDQSVSQEIKYYAQRMNMRVTVVGSLSEALHRSRQKCYDTALIDMNLSDSNPNLLLQKWQNVDYSPKATVVLSGYGETLQSFAKSVDFSNYLLTKPLLFSEFRDLLNRVLGLSNEPRQTPDVGHFKKNLAVLLVEDNEINQLVAKEMLEHHGAMVDVAENGQIAVEKVHEKHYDVILMDIQMPIMDGKKATLEIRKVFSAEQLPIIATTANVLPHEVDEYMKLGMNAHLAKPFEQSMLIHQLSILFLPKHD